MPARWSGLLGRIGDIGWIEGDSGSDMLLTTDVGIHLHGIEW